jgi:DNA polymerase-1
MKKRAILIDGNNLLFRSYYATAYNGNLMKNSKGFPKNALYGFVNMLNKIINEENPEYIMVAFDKGRNFRQDLYVNYKDGRIETPADLKVQFPYAKEICTLLGIKYIECDNYEADDIIGTFARMAYEDKEYDATIISSDKDLLQLISDDVNVKLLKQKDYILMNEQTFFETYNIKPIRMIDLKSLMGDPSDNIPGVKGIGEKTALTLLQKYETLDGVYSHIEEISGKLKEKLLDDKENAYFSYKLATIYKDIDFDYTFESIRYKDIDSDELIELYKELEFNSFLKSIPVKINKETTECEIVEGLVNVKSPYSIYN